MSHRRPWPAVGLLVFFLAVLGPLPGCVDEESVFGGRPFSDDPAPVAGGFLGYAQGQAAEPVCAGCHAVPAAQWRETGHAGAWEALQASGAAQAFCENCHTVSQLGSAETADAGWATTGDARYHDVQCESCHGPGETHVSNPQASQPIPSLAVGVGLQNGCGECHQDTHHPFVEEWSLSPHSQVVGFAAAREECEGCHRGQGTLKRWGVNSQYLEKDSPEHLAVVCGVCHDPHDATNEHQLRFPVATTSIESHLCAQCHNRRSAPDANSTHGLEPHAPEAALLVGDAGWFPPGSIIDQGEIFGTHGSGANEELCATCHVSSFTVRDAATGDFAFSATGHLFRPIPCLDPQGIPLPFGETCELSVEARSWSGCTEAGCHSSADAALFAVTEATNRIQELSDDLVALLLQVDPNLADAEGEIDGTDPTFNVAEGAFFNYSLSIHGNSEFGTNSVVGSTVHNPFLMQALLAASIQAVEDEYGVMLPQVVDWDAMLLEILRATQR